MKRNLTDNNAKDRTLRLRWIMLLFAFLATILNYVDRLAFNYLSSNGPLRELIPNDAFGYIATAFFTAYMLSNLVSGFIIDRLRTRLGYALCMSFWTTASLLHAFARLPFHFGLCRFLLGVGEAGNWPAAIKLTSEWFSPEERSTATGLFNSGAAVGAIAAPPLITWLGLHYGWQATFLIIGGLGYLWVIAFWFTYYTPDRAQKASRGRTIPLLRLVKTRFVSWFTISKIFMDPVWYFITFWIGRYLVDVHGWGLEKIGWFAMFPFIISDLGNILGGLFTQLIIRSGVPIGKARKISVGLFGTLLGVSLILGPFLISSPVTALFILSIAGFGYAAYTSNSMAFPADVVPLSATASVWGIASVGAGLGGALFQSVSGVAIDRLSKLHNYSFAYNAVFTGYGIMALLAVLIVLLLMGPLDKNLELQRYAEEGRDEEIVPKESMRGSA